MKSAFKVIKFKEIFKKKYKKKNLIRKNLRKKSSKKFKEIIKKKSECWAKMQEILFMEKKKNDIRKCFKQKILRK